MWSDNDIDKTFQRLTPPKPEPASFPLDAWLRLETQLDRAVIEREVRRKLWRYFAAEVAVVALVALGWLLWPAGQSEPAGTVAVVAATPASAGFTRATTGAARRTSSTALVRPASTEKMQTPSLAAAVAAPTTARPPAGTPAATVTAAAKVPEAPVAAAPQARRQLAGITPGALRQQARKIRQPKNQASQLDLASSAAAARATPESVRALPKESLFTDRNTPVTAVGTAAAGTVDGPTKSSSAGRASAYTTPSLAGSPSRRVTTAPPAPENSATVVANGAAENSTANAPVAIALRPVALRAGVVPMLPAPLVTVAVADAPALLTPSAPARQPRFYLSLIVAPDVSTVKFADVQSPLPNVGLTLEYRLTDRLHLSTGLLRSTKHYSAHREDYDWGAYSVRVYQRDFRDVRGSCTVLDLPLNLRYDALVRPQYRVFGSAGLSSYFMQREWYAYDYMENNVAKTWTRDAVNENQNLLSILNLSAGYERSFGPRWSFQAEPYFKLPLGGVGAGKVRLASAGVFFGLKYGF